MALTFGLWFDRKWSRLVLPLERKDFGLSRGDCEQGNRKRFRPRIGLPASHNLRMYDRGMDAEKHDLVITAVADLDETVALLQRIAPTVVEPSYEHGTVWRIVRAA